MIQDKERFIADYQPMVRAMATRYVHLLEFDDAIQYGNLGLVRALDAHDGREGIVSFAKIYIQRSIVDGIRKEHGRGTTKLQREQGDVADLVEGYSIHSKDDTEASAITCVLRQELMGAIEKLADPRQRYIIVGNFFQGLSIQEIACTLKLSEARIEQLRRKALLALRAVLTGADALIPERGVGQTWRSA